MNAFSKDFKPELKTDDLAKERKCSEARTKQRRAGLASDDPAKRKIAMGTLPALSKRRKPALSKRSK